MKLLLNYDVIDKIQVAKTGIRLKKIPKSLVINMSVYTPYTLITNANKPEENILDLILGLGIYAVLNYTREVILAQQNKDAAETDLKWLLSHLDHINSSTTYDQLLESKKYKTEYKLLEKNDQGIRKLQQNKYILIPTGNDEKVSVLQEHVIGTNEYSLSLGEPKKVYKLSLGANPA